MITLTDAPPAVAPRAYLTLITLDGEGWTGSSSCSSCWGNHVRPGSRCSCSCHTRGALTQRATAVHLGLSPDCANGCHSPLCSGPNCSCDCHAAYSAKADPPGPVLTPPPNPARPPKGGNR